MTTMYRRNIWARLSDWQHGVRVYWLYHGKCIARSFAGGFALGVLVVVIAFELALGV